MEKFYPASSAHGGLRPERLQEIRATAVEELIVDELAWQRAVKSGQAVTLAETRRRYDRLRRQIGPQAFDRQLRDRGLSSQRYLKKLQRILTLERVERQKLYVPSRLSDKHLRTYYLANLDKFKRPEQVRLRLLMVSVDPNASADNQRVARKKIDDIYQQLKSGKDFAELAYQNSDEMHRIMGGDLGWIHRNSLRPEFELPAFSTAVGSCTEPIPTSEGYALLKVEARESAHTMSFMEVRPRIKQELEQKKYDELQSVWESELKKNARIEIVDSTGNADSAAATRLQTSH